MVVAVTLALSAYLLLLTLGEFYLVGAHLSLGRRALARERACLAAPDQSVEAVREPSVSVQIPIYNESQAVAAAIDAACSLDWPAQRLEILVIDDSTDNTSVIAANVVAKWTACRDVRLLRRADRTGFKAGALMHGLEASCADYIVVFDVDYRPESSFLRQLVHLLTAEPDLAFVQARLGYRNREQNWLTRAQALGLDAHLAYDQAARHWAGVPFLFNGTCAVWRRAAIVDSGGWSSRSLGEDQDLGFRAFAAGWRARFLVTVHVPGELPESLMNLIRQRQRWIAAANQNLRILPWRLLSHLGWHQSIAFVLLCQFNSLVGPLILGVALGTLVALMSGDPSGSLCAWALGINVGAIVVARTIGSALASRLLGRPIGWRFWADTVQMWAVELLLLPFIALASMRGLLGARTTFVRTPKAGT